MNLSHEKNTVFLLIQKEIIMCKCLYSTNYIFQGLNGIHFEMIIIKLFMSVFGEREKCQSSEFDGFYYEILGDWPKNTFMIKNTSTSLYAENLNEFIDNILDKKQAKDNEMAPNGPQFSEVSEDGNEMIFSSTQFEQKILGAQSRKMDNTLTKTLPSVLSHQNMTSNSVKKKKTRISVIERKILKEAPIKKNTKKFAISKFLARIFLKYRQSFFENNPQQAYNNDVYSEFSGKKENKFNLQKDIGKIFGKLNEIQFQDVSKFNRQKMAEVLMSKMKEEVILNSYTEKNRLSYLIGLKVYALRCRSRQLIKKASYR